MSPRVGHGSPPLKTAFKCRIPSGKQRKLASDPDFIGRRWKACLPERQVLKISDLYDFRRVFPKL